MVRRLYNWTIFVLACMGSASLFWTAYDRLSSNVGPPVAYHFSRFLAEHAEMGESVGFELRRTIRYPCEGATVHKIWKRQDSPVYETFGSRPIFGDMRANMDTPGFTATITVPRFSSGGGNWCYQPKLTYHCSDRDITVQQTPACLKVKG